MYDLGRDLLDALRATPATLNWLLDGVTQDEAIGAKGGDENWSVVEVICHLRDAEERCIERVRAMKQEENPFLPGYDQEAWARDRNYAGDELRRAAGSFLRFRREHVAELETLSTAEWQRPGRHEEQGDISILAHTLHIVSHDAQHIAQIATQLAGS